MCYGCSMCNKCGKYDRLARSKRKCSTCKKEPPPEALVCPECGARLPPPFPEFPGTASAKPERRPRPEENAETEHP